MHTCTAAPSRLQEVKGNITSANTKLQNVASVNWLPPANGNETAIDYYELTLNGPNTSSTTVKVDAAVSLPYKFVLPEGNFTTVSVTAVDVCGQRSEPSESALNITPTNSSGSPITCNSEREKQLKDIVYILSSVIALVIAACIVAIIVAILVKIICHNSQCKSYSLRSEETKVLKQTK